MTALDVLYGELDNNLGFYPSENPVWHGEKPLSTDGYATSKSFLACCGKSRVLRDMRDQIYDCSIQSIIEAIEEYLENG